MCLRRNERGLLDRILRHESVVASWASSVRVNPGFVVWVLIAVEKDAKTYTSKYTSKCVV